MTQLARNIVTYSEIDFDNGFRIRLEHEHIKKYDCNRVTMLKIMLDEETGKEVGDPVRIDFTLDSPHLTEFCKFFTMIGEMKNGNK